MSLKETIKKLPFALFVYNALLNKKALLRRWINLIAFLQEYRRFSSLPANKRFKIGWNFRTAITFEKTATTEFDRHYVYHTSWAARCISKTKPVKHIDISSSLYFAGLCYDQIISYFKDLKLESFVLLGEKFSHGGLIENPSEELLHQQGCGCFWFKKLN